MLLSVWRMIGSRATVPCESEPDSEALTLLRLKSHLIAFYKMPIGLYLFFKKGPESTQSLKSRQLPPLTFYIKEQVYFIHKRT